MVSPPSSCPACGARVPFYHNIPILSWFVLRGRCSSCAEPFSARYPLVEFMTGASAALVAWKFGPEPETLAYFAFVAALIVITFIDLDHKIIPDVISLPGVVVGIACAGLVLPDLTLAGSAVGIAAGAGVLLAVAAGYYLLTGTEGMGLGDVKLLAMVGAWLGWKGVLVTLLAGSFTGAVVGVAVMSLYGKDSKYALPFGPFLALGAVGHLFFGPELIRWYVETAVGA